MLSHRFNQGQTIVFKESWKGRVRSVRPMFVVQDKPNLMAFYMPLHTVWKQPTEPDRLRSEWTLKDTELGLTVLRLAIPNFAYSVLFFWNADGSQRCWYINLEDPLQRTEYGFDYTDMLLDIIATPDLTSWRWDDED